AGGRPGKPRSAQPRPCPKENGTTAPRRPPDGPLKTKEKGRGATRGTPKGAAAPPVGQNGPAKSKGRGRGAVARAAGAPPAPSKLLAMDCEMVGTGPGGRISALARCSIVSYDGD
ncbi:I20L2 protein, partial [Xiphorhynchus elegans]|nr:I20L2 protein [Xiphorhynchus elegans]